MTQIYQIEGMTCNGCRTNVEQTLRELPGVTAASVDLERGEAKVIAQNRISASDVQAALPDKYSVREVAVSAPVSPTPTIPSEDMETPSKFQQLKPLFLILFYITVASVLMHYRNWNTTEVMLDFMGLFFIVFSFFKMLDLKGFPDSFRMYDPLAKRVPIYAKVYPFLETALGLMFLLRIEVRIALVITLVVLSITTIGVTRTLLDKRAIRCACLGTALHLPMTEATFIENAIMLVMGVALLIQLW